MQIEPEDALKIIIVVGLFCAAIGFLLGAWAGIGSEKARIKNIKKAGEDLVTFYFQMTEKIEELKKKPLEHDWRANLENLAAQNNASTIAQSLGLPGIDPGTRHEVVKKQKFTDRMKAAKAAKRKNV